MMEADEEQGKKKSEVQCYVKQPVTTFHNEGNSPSSKMLQKER